MIRKIILTILCSALLGAVGAVQAATWQVLGGSVYVDADPVAGSPVFSTVLTPGSPGVLIEGSYQDQASGEIFSDTVVSATGSDYYPGYTMKFITSPLGNTTPPPPSINLTTGYADLSSFRINWFEVIFESPDATNVLMTRNQNGSYHLSWQMVGGFSATGTATMTMDIAPVPLPAAVWLLGSGLIGLIGISRRSRLRV